MLLACQSGSLECVKYLIQKGAKIHQNCNDTTCLMAACNGNRNPDDILPLVEYLVANGASVDHQDCNEKTALMIACRRGLVEVVRFLCNHSQLETKDRWHWTALFHAVDCNQLEIVKILIEKGAETEIEDKKGYRLMQVAEMKGFHDILQLLPQPKVEYVVPLKYLQYSNIDELIPEVIGERYVHNLSPQLTPNNNKSTSTVHLTTRKSNGSCLDVELRIYWTSLHRTKSPYSNC